MSDSVNPTSNLQLPTPNLQPPVLITGVNGFIAGHLAERLLREGVPVRGLVRRPEAAGWLAAQGVEVVRGDLLDAASVAAAVQGCGAVVHAAAWTGGLEPSLPDSALRQARDPDTALRQAPYRDHGPWARADRGAGWRVNVDGTANVLSAARAAGVTRFVHMSSVAVYGLNRAPLIDESMPTPAVGQAYPDSKIAGEKLVREHGLPFVIVRPASTYGPRGTAWTIGPVEKIRQGRLVLLGKDVGQVTPGYIENVIDGLWLALTHPDALGETFNLCDDRAVTYREYYLAYARMLGLKRLPSVPAWSARLARFGPANWMRRLLGRPSVGPWSLHFRFNPSRFSVDKARQVLGYEPEIDFAEGMRRTEIWLREAGYLRAVASQ